jgi:ABC-type nitrate/sulfonate/bicarbonate transport system substrate-binding protein
MKKFLMMIAALVMTTMMAQANEEAVQAVQNAAVQAAQDVVTAAPAEKDENSTKE